MFKKHFSMNKGSVIVDAACALPIFITAMGIVLMLTLQAGSEAAAVRCLAIAAKDVSVAAAVKDDRAFESAAFYASCAGFYIKEKKRPGNFHMDIGEEFLLSDGLYVDNVYIAEIKGNTRVPFSKAFIKHLRSEKKLCFRAFSGESKRLSGYGGKRVYVFPKAGERYHEKNCPILKGGGREEILTRNLRKHLRPCKLCSPDKLPDGASVYVYSEGAGVYHRKSCDVITKKYISMPLEEAERRGYTPCKICGGKDERSKNGL